MDDASLSDDLLSDDDGALDEESDDSLVEPDEFDMNITIDEDDVQQEFSASGDEELRDEDSLVNIPDESFGEEDLESDAPQEEPGEAPAPDEHQVLEQINASLDLDAGLENSAFEQEQEERDEAIHDFEATDEDVLRSEDRAVELREEEEVSRNSVSKISFTPAGEPVLTFESGITLCIHANMLENLASMTVVVEQQELTIIDQGEDYCISVGSLEFTFPKNRAA